MVLKNFEQYTVLVTFCGKDCSGKKLEAYKSGARKLSQNFLKDNQNFLENNIQTKVLSKSLSCICFQLFLLPAYYSL